MAEEMKGTNISSPVVPFTKDDRYATHDETFGRGGYRSVASVSEMNAIPNERRKEGMLINVVGDKIYRLVNGSFVSAFKTINGQSILGSGNVSISGGSGSDTHDLSLDVKTESFGAYNKILFRIHEAVPNGYIQLVIRKKKRCSKGESKLSYNGYAVEGVCHEHEINGISTANLQPNTWYEYPQKNLVVKYNAGSVDAWTGSKRKYDIIKFSGNTYARPIKYINGIADHKTSILDVGLQYNVMAESFLNGLSSSPMFEERGEIRHIKARLIVKNIYDFTKGYIMYYNVV